LLQHQTPLSFKNAQGDAPLHLACRCSSSSNNNNSSTSTAAAEIVQLLLQDGASVHDVNDAEDTPLHIASREGHDEIVRSLLEHDASLEARNLHGDTPLHDATRNDRLDVVQRLLGTMLQQTQTSHLVDAKNNLGQTPLHASIWCSHIQVAKYLLEHGGASVHHSDKRGDTALHVAVRDEDSVEMARMLLQHGASIYAFNSKQQTPVDIVTTNLSLQRQDEGDNHYENESKHMKHMKKVLSDAAATQNHLHLAPLLEIPSKDDSRKIQAWLQDAEEKKEYIEMLLVEVMETDAMHSQARHATMEDEIARLEQLILDTQQAMQENAQVLQDGISYKQELARAYCNNIMRQSEHVRSMLDAEIPSRFCCPITKQCMVQAVVASDGYTYEKSAIQEVLQDGGGISPTTGEALVEAVFPNVQLQEELDAYHASK